MENISTVIKALFEKVEASEHFKYLLMKYNEWLVNQQRLKEAV